uniref:Uncharacterized protein n=1 Tax=Anguilla anguilla TaxID=7936 RepID=A0A0E9RX48_ANGAN
MNPFLHTANHTEIANPWDFRKLQQEQPHRIVNVDQEIFLFTSLFCVLCLCCLLQLLF